KPSSHRHWLKVCGDAGAARRVAAGMSTRPTSKSMGSGVISTAPSTARATVLHGCYGIYIRGLQLEATRLIAQKSAILPVSVLSRNRLHFCHIHNWLILR